MRTKKFSGVGDGRPARPARHAPHRAALEHSIARIPPTGARETGKPPSREEVLPFGDWHGFVQESRTGLSLAGPNVSRGVGLASRSLWHIIQLLRDMLFDPSDEEADPPASDQVRPRGLSWQHVRRNKGPSRRKETIHGADCVLRICGRQAAPARVLYACARS